MPTSSFSSQEATSPSEEQLSLALEAARMATFEYNAATQTTLRSRNASLVQGLGEHGEGDGYYTHVHPDDRAKLRATIEGLTPGQDTYEFEYRFIRPDTGAVIWLLDRAQAFFDEQGKLQRLTGVVLDITPRKKTEEQLAYHAFLLEHIQDAVIAVDHQQCITLWNRGAEELYGWQQAEVLGRPLAEVVKTSTTPDQHQQIRAALNKGGRQVHEVIHQHRDGRQLVVESLTNALRDAAGTIIGYIGINVDISARKQAEIALQQSNAILSGVLEGTNDAIFVRDLEGRYLLVNSAGLEQVGMTKEAIIGKRYHEVFSLEEATAMEADDRPVLEHSLTQTVEHVTSRNGRIRCWHTLKMPLRNAAGEIIGLISSARDITEWKRAEEEIRHLNTELQARLDDMNTLLEILPAGVWIGNADCSEIVGNPAAYRMMGIPAGINASVTTEQPEMPSDVRLFVNGVEVTPEEAPMQQVAHTGKPRYNFEHEILFPDGTRRAVYGSVVPLFDQQGAVRKVIGAYTDFTERKQAEEALRILNTTLDQAVQERTAELTKRLQELDQFAYVTSHDLKAPLRAIEHLAHWISEDAGDVLPPTSRAHLEKMRGRINRMDKLLDDLLSYSRADRYEYKIQKVNVAQLLKDIVNLVTPPQGFSVSEQTPLPVFITQKVPLETVLRNLINNAIKHHDRGDGHVQIAVQDLGEFFEFSVSDDGPGIAPEYHERIFQLFQTLKPRDQVEGSGMGLAIVKKIVESRTGRITVTSTPGQGATFRFTWPKR